MMLVNWLKRFGLCLLTLLSVYQIGVGQSQFKRAGDFYALERNGDLLTSFVYTEVSTFCDGKAWVNRGDLYGYIDTLGHPVTTFDYADVSAFEKGYAIVSKDTLGGNFGVINHTGYEICKLTYSRIQQFSEGLAPIQKDSVWGLLDTFGRELIRPQYDYPPIVITNGFIIVAKNGKWGIVNLQGHEVYPLTFDLITKDGVAYSRENKIYLGLL